MSCNQRDKPGSAWDYTLLGVAIAASLPFMAANVVVYLHRKRRYFRAQGGALLIISGSVAGLIWIIASFVINLHFPRKNSFLLCCPLWSFWLQLTFGFWLWLACQVMRALHIHHLCDTASNAASTEFWTLLWTVLLWIPGLVFSIAATASKASVPRWKGEDCANCSVQNAWRLCSFLILPLLFFIMLVILLLRSRNTKDYIMAMENSHTSEYSLMKAFVIYLLYGVTLLTHSDHKMVGRCFLTFCICCVVFINFWVRLGWPVYLCAFKSESDWTSFEEELRSCGAVCLDKLTYEIGFPRTTRRCALSLQYGDWILRALGAAMQEASECRERISQLEQRKAMLTAKIRQIEVSSSPVFMSSPASAKAIYG